MPIPGLCPSAEVLESFLLGQIAGPEAVALERHLEQCEHCLYAAAVARAEDPLVATARQVEKAPIEAPDREIIDGLIQRCAHLSRTCDTEVTPASATPTVLGLGDAATTDTPRLSVPTGLGDIVQLGTYRVLRMLGSGGMGVVFLAEDMQLGRHVALKVIQPGLAAGNGVRERFFRESRAAAVVKHDHVVTIYQVGEERGIPFLAMEYLEGETLDARLRRLGPLPIDELVRIGREIAEGLAAAHLRGVTHRDIKPSNIWLESRTRPGSREPYSHVKILDFGLARSLLDPRMTHSGQFMGTPAYMAPEQARGESVDARADLFSLGCVLYEMVAGKAPFSHEDAMATLMALATFQPKSLIEINGAVPAALSTLVDRLLAKDPNNRPASAQQVVESLWEIECKPSSTATNPAPQPKHGGPTRRSRWPRILAAVVLVGVIVALGYRAIDGQSSSLAIQPAAPDSSPARPSDDRPNIWPIDALQRDQIPEPQLRIAGNGDPARAPAELVAILGDGRMRHWNQVHGITFSPDGQLLASASNDHTVRLWDIENGHLRKTLIGHQLAATRVRFSPSGKLVATSGYDGLIIFWDTATGTLLKSLNAHFGLIWYLDFSEDGERLASAGEDGKIRLWKFPTGEDLGTLDGKGGPVEVLSFVPKSNSLVSGGADGKLRLWNLESRGDPTVLMQFEKGRINSLACTRDGRLLAVGNHAPGIHNLIKVLDLSTRTELYTLDAQPAVAAHMTFRPDGEVLACAGHSQFAVRQWDVKSGRPLATLTGHKWGTSTLAFHPDGRRVASGGWDGAVLVWDSLTGKVLLPCTGHAPWVNGLAFSPDGLLATGGRDSTIKLWNLATAKELRTLTSHRGEVTSLEFHRDGHLLVSGSADGAIKLWDTTSWKLRTFAGHTSDVRSVAFNAEAETILSGSADQTVKVWDIQSGTQVRTLPGHISHVNSVAWAPDFRTFASGSSDGTIKLWEESTGLETNHLAGHESWIECVAYSPDGSLLASSSNDNTIRLWNPRAGDTIRTLTGHEAHVHSISFSPTEPILASSAFDGTVRLWNLSDGSCRQIIRLAPFGAPVYRVAFSPEGRHLATANGNGTVYILRVAPAVAL